jgi:D-alanyl-lipoteichoic acid acyltransferase DltB (MBOAT superfamily)
MTVVSPFFLVGLLVLSVFLFLLPAGRPRQLLFAACNLLFLACFVSNTSSWIALTAFVLSGYAAARVARQLASSRAYPPFIVGYISMLLASFLIIKKYHFLTLFLSQRLLNQSIAVIGISYMLFRQIHFVIDTAENQIEDASLWEYLNYQLNLFGLLAGPIQRFQDFRESWGSLKPPTDDWFKLLTINARLMFGIIKVQMLGAPLLQLTEAVTVTQLHIYKPADVAKFAMLFYAYPAYIYFNFSGYCDIVIAGAAILGMRMPENFNRPYLARDLIEYWTRWHISLTNWIRDYLFTPLYKSGVERWPRQAATISYFCYFTVLFLAGVWHGSSWNWVVFGLLHGAGVTVAKMWEERIILTRGRKGLREYLKSRPTRVLASVITMNFICVTFLFVPSGLKERVTFLRRFALERPSAVSIEPEGP